MSRGHQRKTCFGGSPAMSDPLVAEIADRAATLYPAAQAMHELPPAPQSDVDVPPGTDEWAELDEQLLSVDSAMRSTERGSPQQTHSQGRAFVLELMRAVRIPTMRALRTASLKPLRAAILRILETQDAQRWAAYHVILGGALSLRSSGEQAYRRANALIEAKRAFDTAYSIYALLQPCVNPDVALATSCACSAGSSGCGPRRAFVPCIAEQDGAMLIARAVAGPRWENGHLLKRAVACLRAARAGADIQSWTWVSSTNNLACALTLLGKRTPTPAGSAMLGEAARVLHEVLKARAGTLRREDRASTLINLAEALLSMAERETPEMRLKKIEWAFTASSVALLTVIPPELAWLVRPERRELE